MFLGTYHVSMDDKGRVSMPARFREVLSSNYSPELIITHLDNYLVAYPREEWLKLATSFDGAQAFDPKGHAYLRLFFARATQCTLDRQGRTVIAPHLRELAALQRELILVGIMNRIELWSQVRWEAFVAEHRDQYAEQAGNLMRQSGLRGVSL